MKKELTWIEQPNSIGLRFVGWASDFRTYARDKNYGWYSRHEEYSEVYRGAVYQFPARKGRPVYVVGYREGETGKNWKDWTDTSTGKRNDYNGPACLDLSCLIKGERGGTGRYAYNDADELRDAAIQADECARVAAEHSRDYDEACQAGSKWQQLGEEVSQHRRDALALIREVKQVGAFPPAICATLREHIGSHVRDIAKLRKDRGELFDTFDRSCDPQRVAAFNDGAGKVVVA